MFHSANNQGSYILYLDYQNDSKVFKKWGKTWKGKLFFWVTTAGLENNCTGTDWGSIGLTQCKYFLSVHMTVHEGFF